jgi:hypothetical protein
MSCCPSGCACYHRSCLPYLREVWLPKLIVGAQARERGEGARMRVCMHVHVLVRVEAQSYIMQILQNLATESAVLDMFFSPLAHPLSASPPSASPSLCVGVLRAVPHLTDDMAVQVQKLKVDTESAMLEMDQILRANELSLSLVAATPAVLALGAALLALWRWLTPRPPDPRWEAAPCR